MIPGGSTDPNVLATQAVARFGDLDQAMLKAISTMLLARQVYPTVYSGGSGGDDLDNGSDPVLGPPYPPTEYQLFANSGQPRLTWTIPDTVKGYITMRSPSGAAGLPNDRVYWFSNSSNPATATPYYVSANSTPVYNKYAPAAGYWGITTPSVLNQVGPPPASLSNIFGGPVGSWFGPVVGLFIDSSFYPYHPSMITGFSLYRSTTGAFSGEEVLIASPASSALSYTDTTSTPPKLYYRLIGHITDPDLEVSFDFPYNDVSIGELYNLCATGCLNGSQWVNVVKWDLPSYGGGTPITCPITTCP